MENSKIVSLFLGLSMALTLCSCSSKSSTNYDDYTPPKSNSAFTSAATEMSRKDILTSKINDLCLKGLAFKSGDYTAGTIPKGEYAFIGSKTGRYYSEEDLSGNIIDNENFDSFGYVYVHGIGNIENRGTLIRLDALEQLDVSGAKEIYEIYNGLSDYLQSGMYKIGVDIPAGVYKLESIGRGYYALLDGPVGNNDIISNDNFNGQKQISTSAGQYLELSTVMIIE